MDRTDVIRGPAIVQFGGITAYVEGDIEALPALETFKVKNSIHGESDERLSDIAINVSFTPAGQWITAHLAVWWPHANPVIGSSIYGATDRDVVILTMAGQKITFKNGAISAMPDIILSAVKTPIGAVTIKCLGANDTAWSDDAKRAVIAAQAFADTSYSDADVPTVPYTAAWGSASPWDSFDTQDGWTISFDVGTAPVPTDSQGLADETLVSVGVMAKCVPSGISEANLLSLLKIQGTGIQRGASLSANANDLVIQGAAEGDPKVTIYNAAPKEAGYKFGMEVIRAGEIGFVGIASYTAGVRGPLFAIGSVPAA